MSRWDPYLDLHHGVLRNRLGITDPDALRQAETDITTAQLIVLARNPLSGHYDLEHLQNFHHRIFGEVYDWAGRLRVVPLGKGGHAFCPPEEIQARANRIFVALAARNYLRGLARSDFLDNLTDLLAILVDLHPFREGNGRTQRAFLAQLARAAGYRLRWSSLTPDENTQASRAANDGNRKPLHDLLDRILTP